MTKERKDTIAVVSAVVMLAFGAILTAIGFFLEPVGEIHDSVLWVLGQCLIYAGSIFGIAYYTKGQITKQIDELETRIKRKEKDDDEDIEERQ